jgi:hypothetical protein
MARLSTGKAYGNTGRRTPQQLLGGTDATAVQGGELAQRQLQTPALQPQAQLTNTFIQAGAPTLGGPVRIMEPPALPAPNRDMANLATALSSFNPALKQVGEAYFEEQQAKEKLAKERGEALAASLAKRGFTDYGEAVREVEKKAATDPSLVPLLTELRANDPRSKRYAVERLQELGLQQSMALAPETVKNTSRLPDGRDRRLVSPNDPAFFDFVTSIVVPPGTSPAVLARNSAALMQTYGNIRNEQQKFAADGNDDLVRGGFKQGTTGSVQQLAGGAITSEQLALALGEGLDQVYNNSRPSLYGEISKNLPKTLVAAVQSIPDPETRLRVAGIIADEVLPNIPTGPRQPDGSRLRLIDTLDGDTTIREFFRDATKNVMEDRDLDQQVRGARAEDAADAAAAQVFTPEVMNDPARLNQAIEQLPALAEQMFPGDVVAQNAFRDRALKAANGKRGVYVQPMQEKAMAELMHQQAMNPNANLMELVPQYKNLYDTGQISLSQYNQLVSNARTSAREDAQGSVGQAKKNAAALERRLKEMATGPGGVLTYEAEAKINEQVAQFFQQQMDYIRSNPGRDVTRDLAGQFTEAVGPMIEAEKQEMRKPLNQTPGEVVNRYSINTNRGKPEDNRKLVQDAAQKVLLPPDVTRQQVRGLLNNDPKALDASTKRMLLRLKQLGVPASEYYTNQLRNMGDNVTPAMQQKLRELDGSNLLSSAPSQGNQQLAAGTGRYSNMATNLLATLQQGALNVIAPPAQARGIDPFMGSPVVATGGMGGLLGLIRSGEGGWNSVNRGRAGDSSPIRNLTSMPIGVVEDMQQRGRVFAVGAYQFTPGVLARARREAGLSPNAPMTPENQNKMAMALIVGSKRPDLAAYVTGRSNDINAAHRDIANEWAALQGPNGRGMYDGDKAGNMASIPAARVRAALQEARRAYLSGRR